MSRWNWIVSGWGVNADAATQKTKIFSALQGEQVVAHDV